MRGRILLFLRERIPTPGVLMVYWRKEDEEKVGKGSVQEHLLVYWWTPTGALVKTYWCTNGVLEKGGWGESRQGFCTGEHLKVYWWTPPDPDECSLWCILDTDPDGCSLWCILDIYIPPTRRGSRTGQRLYTAQEMRRSRGWHGEDDRVMDILSQRKEIEQWTVY